MLGYCVEEPPFEACAVDGTDAGSVKCILCSCYDGDIPWNSLTQNEVGVDSGDEIQN